VTVGVLGVGSLADRIVTRGARSRIEAESFEAKRTQSAELNDSAKLSGRA